MLMIVLSRSMKESSGIAHAMIFFCLTLAYFLHSLRFKAFNYARMSMWHSLSLLGVYWLAFSNVLDRISSPNYAFVILLFAGWGIILIIGLTL
jgi:hypothetical protein